MKKYQIRILKLVDVKDPINDELLAEQLQLLPGSFTSDSAAWNSIKETGKYILLPVCEYTAEEKPTDDGTAQ